ncbi:MAG: PilZ domain-containing protein [Pseudomonas sp.]
MSFHDQNYNEKRDFIRMRVDTEALLKLTQTGEEISVVCQDLSSQGVQVVLDRPLSQGATITLSIASPTPGLQGLEASGQVARCVANEEGQFVVGIQFDEVK